MIEGYKKNFNNNFLVFLYIFLFAFLSTKYKIQGEAAVRPLYFLGLLSSLIFFSWYFFRSSVARKIAISMILQPQIFIFFIILVYILASSVITFSYYPVRQIQDTLYFIFWVSIVPLISIFMVSRKINLNEIFLILTKSIVWYAAISTILAFIVIFNFSFEIGPVVISQSPYLPFRIHGSLGEPTALSALLGAALISIFYLKNQSKKKYKFFIFLFMFGIIASGSRNGLVSIALVFFISLFFEKIKTKKFIFSLSIIFLLSFLLLGLMFALNLGSLILDIFFNRPDFDSNHRFSRLYTWSYTIDEILNGSMSQFFFGHGAYELRRGFGAGYNSILEIAHDFGILVSLSFIFLFLSSFLISYYKYKSTNIYEYKFASMLLVYGFSFNLFMSYFPTFWFNFSTWSLVFGMWMSAIPVKMMIKFKQ